MVGLTEKQDLEKKSAEVAKLVAESVGVNVMLTVNLTAWKINAWRGLCLVEVAAAFWIVMDAIK